MRLNILSRILFLQFFVQISFQIDCTIQNAILNVPSTGCNLPYLQNQIIQVDQIILNGQLTISRYANIQYKTMIVNNGAAMNLQSNYEQIKIEDIGTSSCSLSGLKPITMSLSSQSQNIAYNIYSISNSNQLTLRDLPLGLFHGVKILISSLSGLTEYAIVDKVIDQVVYLQNPLSNNHLSWQIAGTSILTYYPQLVVIDEQRIIFKSACLKIFPQKPQSSLVNSGILFQDMKGLSYENQDPSQIVELTHSIFINSDKLSNSFFQINGKMSNIFIIGVNQLTVNDQTTFSGISQINMYRMHQAQVNINALPTTTNPTILNQWYYNDCQFTLALNNNQASYKLQNSDYLNTQLTIYNAQAYDLVLLSNRLLNFIFSTSNSNINTLTVQVNQIAGKELNLQNVQFTQANIDGNYFDGTGLKYAILLTELSILQQQSAFLTLELDGNLFKNFEYQGYDLITTSLQSNNYQETTLRPSSFYYEVTLKINQYNILPSSQQKVIFLPSLSLWYQDNSNNDPYFALPLDTTLYQNTRFTRISPLTNIIYHKPLFFFKWYLAIFQFDAGQATGYYMDTKTQEFQQTWQTGTSYYLLEDTIYKAFFKSTTNNQLSAAPQQLNLVVYQGAINTFNTIPQIKIYFKQSVPIQTINVKINGKPVASPKYVSIDPIDGSLNIYPQNNNNQQDISINIQITNCQEGQVLSNQQCVSSCPTGQYPLNSICLDGSQKNGYYFLNGQYLPCLGGANNECKTCSASNNCSNCLISSFSQTNLCFANQYGQINLGGSFQNCIQNCQSCQDQQTCSVCFDGYALSQDQRSCNICPKGNFIKDYLCTPCPSNYNCADCFSDQAGTCRSCKPGFTLFQGFCQQTCSQSQYLDNNGLCQSCDPSCLECTGSEKTKCTRCSKGNILNIQLPSQTCVPSTCTNLQFQNNNNKCQNCFDQTNQGGCFDAYPNSIICGTGNFAQQNVPGCQTCDASCKTCLYQSTNCTQCNQDYIFISGNSGQCQKCQDGFYAPINSKTCLICSSPCKTCSGSSNNCLTCLDGFYFDSNSQLCAKCDPSCSKCSGSSTNCTDCQSGLFLSNGKCLKCDVSCSECMNTSTYCTKCPYNTYLSSNQCLSQCPVGQYGDSQQGMCKDCDQTKCKQCQGAKDFCTLCNQNLFVQEGICVSNCSEGFTLLNQQCIKQDNLRDQLEPGALVGIVFGSFIFLILVILVVSYLYKKRKYKSIVQIEAQDNIKNNQAFTNNQLQTQQDIETKNQLDENKNKNQIKKINTIQSNEQNI
ncbi:hypothetical protein ABPG74_009946 [Tetrahymena malaccensis]